MICKMCDQAAVENSKYCKFHKAEAKKKWLEMINAQKQEREDRYANFAQIFRQADQAGKQAAAACTPVPMIVQQHASPFDDNSPVEKSYYVPDGVCGFAWVLIRPGNCSAAHYAKSKLEWRTDHYRGGVQKWISDFGQSYDRKMAYAGAFAQVLRDNGIEAWADGRLD